MRQPLLLLAALALTTAGCDKSRAQAPEAPIQETIPDLILPPKASFVSRTGTEDATAITIRTPAPMEQVANLYRDVLTKAPWKLEADSRDNEGAIALYATREGPPLWVRIWPDTEFNATLVRLAGASVKNLRLTPGTQISPSGRPMR